MQSIRILNDLRDYLSSTGVRIKLREFESTEVESVVAYFKILS